MIAEKSKESLRRLFTESWRLVFPDIPPDFTPEGRIRDYSEDSRFFDPIPAQVPPSGQPFAGASGLSGPPPVASSSTLQLQTPSFTAPPSSPSPRASESALQPQISSFVNPPSSPAPADTPPRSPSPAPADTPPRSPSPAPADTPMRSPPPAPADSPLRPGTPEGDQLIEYLRYYDYPLDLQANCCQISGGLIPKLVGADPAGAIRVVFVENPEHRIPDNPEHQIPDNEDKPEDKPPESFITKTTIEAQFFQRISTILPKCIAKIQDPEAKPGLVACYISTWVSLYSNDKFYH